MDEVGSNRNSREPRGWLRCRRMCTVHRRVALPRCPIPAPSLNSKKLCLGRKKPLDQVRRIDHTGTCTNDHICPRGRFNGIHVLLLRRSLTIWFSASRSNGYACGSSLAPGVRGRNFLPGRSQSLASVANRPTPPPRSEWPPNAFFFEKSQVWWPHPPPTQSW